MMAGRCGFHTGDATDLLVDLPQLSQLALELLDAGQARLQILRQRLDQLVLGDAGRLVRVAQRVFGDDMVLALAQEQPDRRTILRRLPLRVDGGEIEAELAGVLGLELAGLELDHDVRVELQVIEEQVDVEVLAAYLEVNLAADEGEAGTELEEEARHV